MNGIRAILFDLDDTLAPDEAAAAEAFFAAGRLAQERHGIDPAGLRGAVRARARELWHAHPRYAAARRLGISSWEALWARFEGADPDVAAFRGFAPRYRVESWRRGLAEFDVVDDPLAEELSERFATERRARLVPFPDAHATLEALRGLGRYRLGVVTNGLSCLQREKLETTGLAGRFDAICAAGDLGIGKPDPRPFRRTLTMLGCRADQAVMIGDSLERDVAGALCAGLKAVWLDRARTGTGRPVRPSPSARITSLDQLRTIFDPSAAAS